MFKFNFEVDVEPDNAFVKAGEATYVAESSTSKVACYTSAQILVEENILKDWELCKPASTDIFVGDVGLKYVDCIKNEDNSDLLPGIYEGGGKIWECTFDLLKFLSEETADQKYTGKSVLDLGCGSGLLGLFALKCGAEIVRFQDYNRDVLERVTIPNLLLNVNNLDVKKLNDNVQFYSGDWEEYTKLAGTHTNKFDVILTSETIYNPDNQLKLLNCVDGNLKQDGVVYVAAKTYYFGVGGSLRTFENLINTDGRFTATVVWKTAADEGVSREILKLKRLSV